MNEIKVGDVLEGTGKSKKTVEILSVSVRDFQQELLDDNKVWFPIVGKAGYEGYAVCRLLKNNKVKLISKQILNSEAYRLVNQES